MIGLEPEFLNESPGNRMNTKLAIDKTKALGWKAKHDLETYISKFS